MKPMSFKMNRMFFLVVLGGLFVLFFMLTSAKEGFELSGSWSDTCNLKGNGNDTTAHLLTARCKSRYGHRTNTNFNYGNCPNYQVTNNNGILQCA